MKLLGIGAAVCGGIVAAWLLITALRFTVQDSLENNAAAVLYSVLGIGAAAGVAVIWRRRRSLMR